MVKIGFFMFLISGFLFGCNAESADKMESEVPMLDFKIPIELGELEGIKNSLKEFGELNNLIVLENGPGQMAILNGGSPAFSFWFLFEEDKTPAIVALTVNEGDAMRVMFFENAFPDESTFESYSQLFKEKFGIDIN